jgi:20S proteasome alpha/beta subunit
MLKYNQCEQKPKKGMTYILGAKCDDGVVLVADRRVTVDEGSNYEYVEKITSDLNNIIIAYSGSRRVVRSIRNDLLSYKLKYQREEDEEPPIHRILQQLEEICHKKNSNFKFYETFDLLVAISGQGLSGSSQLMYFYPDGLYEDVNKFKAIGKGSPHGTVFLNKYSETKNAVTMEDAAELGYFVIRYIEEFKLDLGVGLDSKPPYDKPQIWFVPDSAKGKEMTPELFEKFESSTKERLNKINSTISELW